VWAQALLVSLEWPYRNLQLITEFGLDWNDVPADVKMFIQELQVLAQALLAIYSKILNNPEFSAAFDGRSSVLLSELGPNAPKSTDTRGLLNACSEELNEGLGKLRQTATGRRFGLERLKETLLKKRTRDSVTNLHRQCQLLSNMVGIDSLSLTAKIHNEIKGLHAEQRDANAASLQWRQEEKAQKILRWLSPTDYGTQQSDFFNRRQEGTGRWFLESAEFQEWHDNAGKTLYCQGMPGAGKTIMTSIVVDELFKLSKSDRDMGIAYVYCNFRRQEEQSLLSMLASLLKQLVLCCSELPSGVEELFGRHASKNTHPSSVEIVTELHNTIRQLSRCYILVDALDECSISDGSRWNLVNELKDLQSLTSLNLFLTSRSIMQIAQEIGTDCLQLEIRAADTDVQRFLASQLDRLPAFVRRDPAIQTEIKTVITQAVDGMYVTSFSNETCC
jgi:hypothetical protein